MWFAARGRGSYEEVIVYEGGCAGKVYCKARGREKRENCNACDVAVAMQAYLIDCSLFLVFIFVAVLCIILAYTYISKFDKFLYENS